MILIIDNYDSFTYNLVQLVGQHTNDLKVIRNDTLTVAEVSAMKPGAILLSPGPGRPEHAGICVELIRELGSSTPILGVCLGHQAIGFAFGGTIVHSPVLVHGKTSSIHHHGDHLFKTIPNPFDATRYHSLIISEKQFPDQLTITARTKDNLIMGVRHKAFPIEGIQFHPESVLTTAGPHLIANWLRTLKEAA